MYNRILSSCGKVTSGWVFVCACVLGIAGLGCVKCLFPVDRIATAVVQGTIIAADTQRGLSTALVGGQLVTDEEVTQSLNPSNERIVSGDGSFGLLFIEGFTPSCRTPIGPPLPPPQIPAPTQIRIVVVQEVCEYQFMFDVNGENFVDPDAPDGVLELRQPVLVPPCEE